MSVSDTQSNYDEVICPNCVHQFRAIPVNVQAELAAAIAQRDKAIEFLQVYRHDTPLGHQPHMIAHEVDQFLKECGK